MKSKKEKNRQKCDNCDYFDEFSDDRQLFLKFCFHEKPCSYYGWLRDFFETFCTQLKYSVIKLKHFDEFLTLIISNIYQTKESWEFVKILKY